MPESKPDVRGQPQPDSKALPVSGLSLVGDGRQDIRKRRLRVPDPEVERGEVVHRGAHPALVSVTPVNLIDPFHIGNRLLEQSLPLAYYPEIVQALRHQFFIARPFALKQSIESQSISLIKPIPEKQMRGHICLYAGTLFPRP